MILLCYFAAAQTTLGCLQSKPHKANKHTAIYLIFVRQTGHFNFIQISMDYASDNVLRRKTITQLFDHYG
jgi:hypothetical protein